MKSIGIVLNVDPDQGQEKGTLSLFKLNSPKQKHSSELASPKSKGNKLIEVMDTSQRNKRKLP